MAMTFEGSEKKLEIVLKSGAVNARRFPKSFWADVVQKANAQILSELSSDACDAYLLSESSLFVWADRVLMITCGTTTLADAGAMILGTLKPEQVEAVFYQRKNEYFPREQKSDFTDDCRKLRNFISGRGYRLGNADEHHLYLFHSDNPARPPSTDTTLEVLMYDLQGPAKDAFIKRNMTAEFLEEVTGVNKILPDFEIDDYAFSPFGYSLNALKGSRYYTIHVTPQKESPYVSFETNVTETGHVEQALTMVLEVFRPKNFDVVFFDSEGRDEIINLPGYQRRTYVRHQITPGFVCQFTHFAEPQARIRNSVEIKF
jgi:S-adenosylmethionine decarboxylase